MEREPGRPAGPALARQNSCSRETGEPVSPWRRRQEVRLRVGRLPSWARGGEKTGLVKLEKEAANSTFPTYYIAIKFSEQTLLLSLEEDIRAYCRNPWCPGVEKFSDALPHHERVPDAAEHQRTSSGEAPPLPSVTCVEGAHVVRLPKVGRAFLVLHVCVPQ